MSTTPREASVVRVVRELIDARGGRCIKLHPDKWGLRGEPDLLCCLNGRFIAIECKAPGQKPTPLQLRKLELWREAGALAFWTDSVERTRKELLDGEQN